MPHARTIGNLRFRGQDIKGKLWTFIRIQTLISQCFSDCRTDFAQFRYHHFQILYGLAGAPFITQQIKRSVSKLEL
jgi:hypothetical protein